MSARGDEGKYAVSIGGLGCAYIDEQKTEYEKFKTINKIFFKAAARPSDSIFAQNHKEFRTHCKSIEALEKMKSAALFTAAASKDRKSQVGNLEISWRDKQSDVPDIKIDSIPKLLFAIKLMVRSWALGGTNEVPSKRTHGVNVRVAELTECIDYEDFLHTKILEFPGSARECIAWAMVRDQQTRSSARDLYLEGWPWGEAISEARERKCAVLWTVGNSSPVGAPIPVMSQHVVEAASHGARPQVHEAFDAPCPNFNQEADCAAKQRDCRFGMKHMCSFQIPGKGMCADWRHGAHRCPSNPNRIKSKRELDRQGTGGSRQGGDPKRQRRAQAPPARGTRR